jgi:aminopeptidase N
VVAETAAAIGATRAPWARSALIEALSHAQPKVRRAVATALGNYRDAEVATALIPVGQRDPSYFVRAAALHALGKTRDARGFDVLSAAAKERTWNGTVEGGAVRGLAELADARAMGPVLDAARPENDEGVRRSAVWGIGRIGELVESERTRAVGALDQLLGDATFMVQVTALQSAEALGDARLLPPLDHLAQAAFDGRIKRDALEAAIRVREAAKVPAQVSGMRSDIDGLREEHRKLQEKIEALSRS